MAQTIKIDFIICLTVSRKRGGRDREKEEMKQREQEAREQNPC